jgi:phage portal protein BeeE
MNPMFEFFRKARGAPEHKSGPGSLLALSLGGAARWGGRDTASLARTGVMQNAVAYACVRKIASAAASVPWLLYDGAAELESHPLLTLLARPNPQEDGASLFER